MKAGLSELPYVDTPPACIRPTQILLHLPIRSEKPSISFQGPAAGTNASLHSSLQSNVSFLVINRPTADLVLSCHPSAGCSVFDAHRISCSFVVIPELNRTRICKVFHPQAGCCFCRGKHGSLSRSASQSLPPPTPTATPEDELKPPIPNVRLGPLLGKGSFGSVHYGTWNGAQIAVKVLCHTVSEPWLASPDTASPPTALREGPRPQLVCCHLCPHQTKG